MLGKDNQGSLFIQQGRILDLFENTDCHPTFFFIYTENQVLQNANRPGPPGHQHIQTIGGNIQAYIQNIFS